MKPKGKSMLLKCSNRYEPLHVYECSDRDVVEDRGLNLCQVESNIQRLRAVKGQRRLRVATWNFSGLGSDRKQKEISELLLKHGIDVVAGQESWEKEGTRICIEGYKTSGLRSLGLTRIVRGEKVVLAF